MCVQGDAAVARVTRGLQQVIADLKEQVQRLKHAAANSDPVVQQLSQAFRLLHALEIERSADKSSIAALRHEVWSLPLQSIPPWQLVSCMRKC